MSSVDTYQHGKKDEEFHLKRRETPLVRFELRILENGENPIYLFNEIPVTREAYWHLVAIMHKIDVLELNVDK